MAKGWAGEDAVQKQIDSTVNDAVRRARNALPRGASLPHCETCEAPIPQGRRRAIPGVRLCVACQQAEGPAHAAPAGYNRRASKNSQLR